MRWLGKYSFPFYVIHAQCIWLFPKLLSYVKVENTTIEVLVTLVGTIIASIAIQHLFVTPVCNLSLKLLNHKKK